MVWYQKMMWKMKKKIVIYFRMCSWFALKNLFFCSLIAYCYSIWCRKIKSKSYFGKILLHHSIIPFSITNTNPHNIFYCMFYDKISPRTFGMSRAEKKESKCYDPLREWMYEVYEKRKNQTKIVKKCYVIGNKWRECE